MKSKRYLVDNKLDKWFHDLIPEDFTEHAAYKRRLSDIFGYLKKHIYPQAEKGAIWQSIKDGNTPKYLNDHGEEHVIMVIDRATDLLSESKSELSFYEAYLLLVAIYLHDSGIILGRDDHEKKCNEILNDIGTAAGEDSTEKRIISEIAAAHGGKINGDKDTLGKILKTDDLLGIEFRKQFLAALLRFSDELADDRKRASRFMLENNLLEGSEVFHAYSNALSSVKINEKDIQLKFELCKNTILNKCEKEDKNVYLIDEIFERTVKMHHERMYCMRVLRSEISIDSINVRIEIYENGFSVHIAEPIIYRLEETGYPDNPENGIYSLHPELKVVNGESLKKKLSKDKMTVLASKVSKAYNTIKEKLS